MARKSNVEYANKRRSERFPLDRTDAPMVEFALEDGSFWQLALLELSASGMRFGLDDKHLDLSVGTVIKRATIRARGACIGGRLRIVHITPGEAWTRTCGAEFAPMTEADKLEMVRLLGELEKRARHDRYV